MGDGNFRNRVQRYAQGPACGEPEWRHALSLFGDIKYPAGFKHFDYVNPAAPKGGVVRLITVGRPSTTSISSSPGERQPRAGVDLLYDTLMVPAPGRGRGRIRAAGGGVSYPDDYSSVIYRLRDNAKWHDGKPVTAEDVIFSSRPQEEQPATSRLLSHVIKAEKDRRARNRFYLRLSPATANCRRSSANSR